MVPGAIGIFYAMQVALTRARATNRTTEYLSALFHQDVHFWRELCKFMDIRTTYLVEIVHRDASDLEDYAASGVEGGGGVWVDANDDRVNRV